jgi:hypothetical protein
MAIALDDIAQYREKLKELDLRKPEDMKLYKQYRRELFIATEGMKLAAYLLKGVAHVGIGFNMQRKSSYADWHEAFGAHAPDFQRVMEHKQHLNKFQVEQLYTYTMRKIEERLRQIYGRQTWERLKPNERMAMESLYFTDEEEMVGVQSRFYKYMKDYTAGGEAIHATA